MLFNDLCHLQTKCKILFRVMTRRLYLVLKITSMMSGNWWLHYSGSVWQFSLNPFILRFCFWFPSSASVQVEPVVCSAAGMHAGRTQGTHHLTPILAKLCWLPVGGFIANCIDHIYDPVWTCAQRKTPEGDVLWSFQVRGSEPSGGNLRGG